MPLRSFWTARRPADPAPQFMDSFANLTAPRTPSWNTVNTNKHAWLQTLPPMDSVMTEYSDHLWRRRLRSLQSVDALVERQFAAVEAAGAMDRTVFICEDPAAEPTPLAVQPRPL